MKSITVPLFFALGLGLTGCTPFPDLGDTETKGLGSRSFPSLKPLEDLKDDGISRIDLQSQPELEARIARLKTRAARLKRSVIDPEARNRLSQRPVVADSS